MNRVKHWLEMTACPRLEPIHDERVAKAARKVARSMRQEGRFFDFREATRFLKVANDDVPLVRDRVYELCLKNVLERRGLSEKERNGLTWIAKSLRMSEDERRWVELRVGRMLFEEYLAFAIVGGWLDEEEISQLRSIAASLEITTRHLLLTYLAESGEVFLERVLSGLDENESVSAGNWRRLLGTAEALGASKIEFCRLLRPHAQRYAGRIRPDAKAGSKSRSHQLRHLEIMLKWMESEGRKPAGGSNSISRQTAALRNGTSPPPSP